MSGYSARYQPGNHAALVTAGAAILAPRETLSAMLRFSRGRLTSLEVINLLADGNLTELPEFAAAINTGSDLIVLVRGSFEVVSGSETYTGVGTSTWVEQRLPLGAGTVVLRPASGHPETDIELPLAGGAVLAHAFAVQFAEETLSEPADRTEANEAPPEPEPEAETNEAPPEPEEEAEVEPQHEAANAAGESREPDPGATLDDWDDNFDAMFHTVHGLRPEDAAVRRKDDGDEEGAIPESGSPARSGPVTEPPPPISSAEPAPPEASVLGDHDGRTITAAELKRLKGAAGEVSAPPAGVAARPEASASPVPRARLEISDGQSVSFEGHAVIGRRPRAHQAHGAHLPEVIVLDDPYISGTHLEVLLDGVGAVAIDRSTNGTYLQPVGGKVGRLVKDERTPLPNGAVLILSDDLRFVVHLDGVGG